MKTSPNKPPNYGDIIKAIPAVENYEGAIFCYGDTVYNVKTSLRKDLEVHEAIHSRQQGDEIKTWWEKFLNDPQYRLTQEIEAYAAQYIFVRKFLKGRLLKDALDSMAHDLSSSLYGNLLTHGEAVSKIRNHE